jgi:type IV secretory pathway VirB10-like protein
MHGIYGDITLNRLTVLYFRVFKFFIFWNPVIFPNGVVIKALNKLHTGRCGKRS